MRRGASVRRTPSFDLAGDLQGQASSTARRPGETPGQHVSIRRCAIGPRGPLISGLTGTAKPRPGALFMDWRQPAFLAGIVLLIWLAFALRLLFLGRQSLWSDETFTVHVANLPLGSVSHLPVPDPVLHYYLIWFWAKLGGTERIQRTFPIRGLRCGWGCVVLQGTGSPTRHPLGIGRCRYPGSFGF